MQYKDYKSILLFSACVFWYVLFDKKLIVLHHGDNTFLLCFNICIKLTLSAIILTRIWTVNFLWQKYQNMLDDKTISSQQNSKNLEYYNKRIKKFRNYLPHWGTGFRDNKYFFSAESCIYRWPSHRFSFQTLRKIWVKRQKQPLWKKVFLATLQILQKNTSDEFSFKQSLEDCNFIKKCLRHGFFQWICKIFKNTYFEEHMRATASEASLNFCKIALYWYLILLAQIVTYDLVFVS